MKRDTEHLQEPLCGRLSVAPPTFPCCAPDWTIHENPPLSLSDSRAEGHVVEHNEFQPVGWNLPPPGKFAFKQDFFIGVPNQYYA